MRRALLGAALLVAVPASAGAQSTLARWDLDGLVTGHCVEFLVSPDSLDNTPFERLAPLPAAAVTDTASLAGRTARAEAPYRTWLPSTACLFTFRRTRVGGDIQEDDHDPQGILLWELGGPADPAARTMLFTSDGRLRREGRLSRLTETAGLDARVDRDTVTEGLLIRAEVGDSRFHWEGRVDGGGTAPAAPLGRSWRLIGTPDAPGPTLRLDLPFERQGRMVGSVRVLGDGTLARLLQASPIRWASTLWQGGDGVGTVVSRR